MKAIAAVALVASFVAVNAQTLVIADLPECINSCFDPTFLAAVITSCPKLTADMPCLCNNKQFIDSVLTCIYVTCNSTVLENIDYYTSGVCTDSIATGTTNYTAAAQTAVLPSEVFSSRTIEITVTSPAATGTATQSPTAAPAATSGTAANGSGNGAGRTGIAQGAVAAAAVGLALLL